MNSFIPEYELAQRLNRLQVSVDKSGYDVVFITDTVEHLYYTGTIQNGLLVVPARGDARLFIRRNIDRAMAESPLRNIHQYVSYRDVSAILSECGIAHKCIGFDESTTTVTNAKLLKKCFPNSDFVDFGLLLKKNRSVKSSYEIAKLREAGKNSSLILGNIQSMLRQGITEWELSLELFHQTTLLGNNCVSRLAACSGELFLGNICFGDSSLYPTTFDGPGGLVGRSPVCPFGGSSRKLKSGDLVYIDIAYPFDEYYVDKTRVFSYGAHPENSLVAAHNMCLDVQEFVRNRLRPGEIPSQIYDDAINQIVVPSGHIEHFMGFGSNQVKFVGHGIGLVVNEYPVIAKKFDEPLEEGMVLAIEPKKGIPGVGLVGIENTFLVTKTGGECLTADSDDIKVLQIDS